VRHSVSCRIRLSLKRGSGEGGKSIAEAHSFVSSNQARTHPYKRRSMSINGDATAVGGTTETNYFAIHTTKVSSSSL
jgi:hypothetical protein